MMRSLLSWRCAFGLVMLGGMGAYAAAVLVPAFQSPRSRMYASRLGYPAVQRWRGLPIEVRVRAVEVRPVPRTIAARGCLAYLNVYPVRSEVLGVVTGISAEAGQQVKKGDVLLTVHTGGYAPRLALLTREQKRADVEQARLIYERLLGLYQSGKAAALQQVQQAELAYKSAQTALAVAEENYRQSLLTRSKAVTSGRPATVVEGPVALDEDVVATATGTVIERLVTPGTNLITLRDDAPLFLIGDRLVFQAEFDQRYAGVVRKGVRGQFYLRAYPGQIFEGEVVRVAHKVSSDNDASGGAAGGAPFRGLANAPYTFSAWIALVGESTSGAALRPGMNGYCLFKETETAPAIPEGALMRYSGRSGTVLVVGPDNRLQVRQVTYAGSDDGWVAIRAGLRTGERVVIEGQVALRPGDEVVPVSACAGK
jgi:multidrug efflux pump subunit AcrA (membrane-fusion protein)